MNWDDLRVFLAVARSESLSRAGRQLRIDPATVGRRVKRLEDMCNARLFTKSPQGYKLTEAGARLLAHTEKTEQAVMQATDALDGQNKDGLSGQVRIGATDGCASFILPRVCEAITRDNPDLELQIVALPRVINLSKREADLAITVTPPEAGRITTQKITDYHLHFAASQEYIDAHGPINNVHDLRRHRMVGYIQDMIYLPDLDFLKDLELGRVGLASNLVSVQLGMLRSGAGVGVTHDFILPYAPELQKILQDEVSFTRSFHLLRHADDAGVERINRVASDLITGVRNEVARLEAQT